MKKIMFLTINVLLIVFLLYSPVLAKEIKDAYSIENIQDMNYLGTYTITFYCSCSSCCGSWAGSPTASGVYPKASHTCACSEQIPFGTEIFIQGLGTYVCEDRGVPAGWIDIYVNDHSEIPSWGLGSFEVYEIK